MTANNVIAFQGRPGAYSNLACRAAYTEMQTLPCESFEDMFADFGAALPAPTLFVIGVSKWLQANFLYCIVGIAAAIFGTARFYRTPRGKLIIDRLLLQLPVFGELLTKVAVARFCRTLGTMVSSGVPILEALGSFAKNGQGSTQELLRKRYHESANLVRQHSNQEPR